MLAKVRERWFLVALVTLLVAGLGWPGEVGPLIRWIHPDWLVAVVTFIMALPLETSAIWGTVRRPGAAWLGALINAGVCPPLGWLASRLLPAELAIGLIVAAAVPCTLATAAVWTRRAGGNDAVAFLVTMITNLGCFLVVPAWLWLLSGIHANVDYGHIVIGLILLIVAPIILAQLLRQWRHIGESATRHKKTLSWFAQLGVLAMVLIGAVSSGEKLLAAEDGSILSAANILLLVAGVTFVHLSALGLGLKLSSLFGFSWPDSMAVAFAGSQKTLMVGSYVALAVGPLAILPMVAYHAVQLFVDTLIADRWAKQSR
ncbi:MAG: bile acid:sodium symporter family protein [Pirellulales bacterium]